MQLKSVKSNDIETITPWLIEEKNYQWLDFGRGVQKLEPPVIKMMIQRDIHDLRIFTSDELGKPIGLVALSDIDNKFKTAVLWYLLGNKDYSAKSYTTRAVKKMLSLAFEELKLESIFAWVIEKNIPSRKVLEKNNFKYIGKRRRCHYINNKPYDRLYYDLIADDYVKFEEKENVDKKLQSKILDLLMEDLELEVPSMNTDLIDNGYLDSLRFIQLMAELEEKFNISISIEDLDFESFTTIENIATFVEKRLSKK